MYQTLLHDSRLFTKLAAFDRNLAATTQAAGCSCGGKLHRARYARKPRGGPADLGPEFCWRESFCCDRDGCRRRSTPPALLFLDRKVFFSVWVLLLAALRNGPTPRRMIELSKHYRVSERTIRRWQHWWRESLPQKPVWVALKGRFASPVADSQLPFSLLGVFGHLADPGERVVAVLRCLLSPSSVALLGERAW